MQKIGKRIHDRLVRIYEAPVRKGLLGRYKQAQAYLHVYSLRGIKSSAIRPELDDKVEYINKNYSGVRLWLNNRGDRIGEYLSRYIILMRFVEENNDGYLNVMFDSSYDVGNKALSNIINRNVQVINTENKPEWVYILSKVRNVDYSKYFMLDGRGADCYDKRIFTSDWCRDKLCMSDDEAQYCGKKMAEMNLREPYVCIFNRDSAFLKKMLPDVDTSYHNYRDSSIETRYQMIDYLNGKGIRSVRVGKAALERCDYGGCIDYTFDYRNELMDVYLHSKAKFIIGDCCGLNMIPLINNGHYVSTNTTPLFRGTFGMPVVFDGIILFKKIFDTKRNRFLTLAEMVEADEKAQYKGQNYQALGLKHIENSSQEILDAAIEMNERIDGTWKETDEDKWRQEKFSEFQQHVAKLYGLAEGEYFHVRVGARFLEQNWDIFGL